MRDSNSRPVAGAAALLLSIFLTPPAEAMVDGPWISLRHDEYELLADRSSVEIPVPVKLADGVAASAVEVELIEVRLDKRADRRLETAFDQPGSLREDPSRGPSLPITVDLDAVTMPGSYELLPKPAVAPRNR